MNKEWILLLDWKKNEGNNLYIEYIIYILLHII